MSEKRIAPIELAPKVEPGGPDEAAVDGGNRHSAPLDGLAFLVEHSKFILVATLIAGALAYGVALLVPKVYTSVAFLGPLDDPSARTAQVVIQSAPVLDPVIEKFPQYRTGYSLDDRREYLQSRLGWTILKGSPPKSALYALSLDDKDPGLAQALLNAILERWLESLAPRPDTRDLLLKNMAASEVQANDLSQVISELKKRPDALVADIRSGYYPPNIVDMIRMRTETAAKIAELTQQLRAGSRDLIFRAPTLPERPSGPAKKTIVAAAMAATLCGLIAFFLMNWWLARVSGRPHYASVFARIGRALPW
jgi:uncharacterized protein involved in exopolysaccharide biosynthesis